MMPSYQTRDPKGRCGDASRGAALGRNDLHDAPLDAAIKLHVRRIHIDQQGYDENGTYWGDGDPLFWYADEDGKVDACVRARDRADAIHKVHEHYANAEIAPAEVVDPGFLAAYIECALWSSTDGDDTPLDKEHNDMDLAPETLAAMRADCETFQRDNAHLLARAYGDFPTHRAGLVYDAEHAGHDFWLTRNGHGAGFWDRGLGSLGDALTEACKKFGECNLYVGDDGKIYF